MVFSTPTFLKISGLFSEKPGRKLKNYPQLIHKKVGMDKKVGHKIGQIIHNLSIKIIHRLSTNYLKFPVSAIKIVVLILTNIKVITIYTIPTTYNTHSRRTYITDISVPNKLQIGYIIVTNVPHQYDVPLNHHMTLHKKPPLQVCEYNKVGHQD